MSKIRCLIVDDEQLARTLLKDFISKMPQLELVGSCKNSMQALETLQQTPVDLMFLDIQMPDLTGIEMLKTLGQKPVVILTTAYPDYALEGYALDVTDYLLKPFSFERFIQSVNKASGLIRLKKAAESKQQSDKETANYLTVNADHKLYKIKFDDILYIEGLKEYVRYYTAERQVIALQSLKGLEESLPSDRFLRIHRSYIISLDKVSALEGSQVEVAGKMIPIGKSYKESVLGRIFK